jgi:NAD(P)-dependent dehydrogenase (short-subunit alcohol dehydrogenase family)
MNLKLTDKTALVSGSTKGIGFAIATGLAREGARVIVNGRSEKAVAASKERHYFDLKSIGSFHPPNPAPAGSARVARPEAAQRPW